MDKYELIEKLRNLDEVTLIDLLGVTSDQIVDAFLDVIDERDAYIRQEIEE